MKGTIRSKDRISWIFVNGDKFTGTGFLAIYHTYKGDNGKGNDDGFDGLGEECQGKAAFIAGKKLGTAPERNRAKRRLREAARRAQAPWENCDVVFVAKRAVLKAGMNDITRDMEKLKRLIVRKTCGKENRPMKGTGSGDGLSNPSSPSGHTGNNDLTSQENDTLPSSHVGAIEDPAFDLSGDSPKKLVFGQQQDDTGKKKVLAFVVGIPRAIALLCISVYRHAISPLFPPSCRYVPTCSEYAMLAFKRFGFWRGLWLSARRVGRCHPFAEGGYDPVPESFSSKLA